MKVKSLSRVQLFVTPWTVAYQASPSMRFSRQEYWSGLIFSSPGDFPDPGIKPRSPTLQADTLPSEPPGKFQESFLELELLPFCSLYCFSFLICVLSHIMLSCIVSLSVRSFLSIFYFSYDIIPGVNSLLCSF